jgi:hypothetical protein
MKESKTVFICAVMALTATVIKIILNIGDAIPVNVGWSTDLICDILSVYVVCNSKVKKKVLLAVCGALIYIMIGVILATMATFGLIEAP